VVTATVDIVQWYCVLCGDYCGYINSRYTSMFLCFVWSFFTVTTTGDIVQCYCVVVEIIVVTATVDIV